LFIKYNNDNNPFYIATITPMTVMGGLTKIGGYITIFGLLKIALFLYNRHSFETKLLKKYKQKIKSTLDEDDDRPIDKNTIRELMSYEMLMQLVLNYLKDRRDFRMSTLNIGSEQSKTSIQRKDDDEATLVEEDQDIEHDDYDIEKNLDKQNTNNDSSSSKKKKRKNKHFVDGIHDSDEEDSKYFKKKMSERKSKRRK